MKSLLDASISCGRMERERLLERYEAVRARTGRLVEGLPIEDQLVQTMTEVSPTRWHLAHTTWFFETFLLKRFLQGYQPFAEGFEYLFNSYYEGAGPQFPRDRRGMLGRPTVEEIWEYRRSVDRGIGRLLLEEERVEKEVLSLVEIGLQHEMQHQELILTDIKHVLWSNPLKPVYRESCAAVEKGERGDSGERWISFEGGVHEIGTENSGFYFDNEGPRHKIYLEPFALAGEPVSCGEYREFIEDGGYEESRLWLSLGWEARQREGWEGPLYWEKREGEWTVMTLGGLRELDEEEPLVHVSYFEADAYARWRGARLPREGEWERASERVPVEGNFMERERFHPRAVEAGEEGEAAGLFGDCWEWTASPYEPYPGFEAWKGVLGEYNGKFMCNQYVLRGGSCATAREQIRRSYRNFFPPEARWQFSGIRLARSL